MSLNLFILTIDTSMELSILYCKELQVQIFVICCFLLLKSVFIFANSADTGKMSPYVAFYTVLHCLTGYLITSECKLLYGLCVCTGR